ncbi:MAG: cold shock domain-containing protein [Bacteroidetes bacterium]|nr:cold shock domain-containing protein [Bacteroidota bacterium]
MKKGAVKFFNNEKKFGFISCPEDGKEYYVHIKDILSPIKTGDEVTFELSASKRGDQAVNVKKI